MLSQPTIPKEKPAEPALNQQTLYAIGLEHVQKLSSRLWTDYNVHDPGVTTLELLCYALTDLGYRASFPMKDLLASPAGNVGAMGKQFFTARRILPNRPLTLLDYRKLLIDLKGVKNAWLQPAEVTYYADVIKGKLLRANSGQPGLHPVRLQGIYDVIIEFMDDITTAADREKVMDSVRRRLHANRNLCEDFAGFGEVASQEFVLCAELELAPDADVAKVQADIYFQVQEYLAPAVANYTLTEMLARKHEDGSAFTVDEIFNGPALDCGFIDDSELAAADLREEIRLSDVISIIMDVEGVRAVRDIVINPRGTTRPLADKWTVPVAARRKALLNRAQSRLVYYKRNMPVTATPAKVEEQFQALVDAARAKAETAVAYDLDIPTGKFRDPADYYSFQNHFPAVYGLGEQGLGGAADDTRRAQALQLKAYLLFFDQIMANYFAQLSHARELLSADPALRRTYFGQTVDSFADSPRIYVGGPGALEQALEDDAGFAERRNRFLDHLIARFAERFTDFANIMYSAFGSNPAAMIPLKCEFLRDYPAISGERGMAYDCSLKRDADLWNSANVSGLEKRLAKLLGIRNFTRRNLGEVTFDVYAEVDGTPGDEFRWRLRHRETGEILLSSSTKYPSGQQAKQEMQTAIGLARTPCGHQRKVAANGKHYFNIVDATGEVVARRIEYFDTAEAMDAAITSLVDYLHIHYSDEGMYVIEPVLLRPSANPDPFLPICPDPNCTDCAEADPYSYRIHVILPAYASRFANMDFRRFVEEVIREETPAHILPRVCWISKEDMAVLEKAYRDWIHLRAGAETAGRAAKLKAFIEILFAVKNVHPPRPLHECGCGEEKPKFLLGQSVLGSMKQDGV